MVNPPSLFSQIKNGTIQKMDLLPIEYNEEKKPRDWIKITAVVVLVLSGLAAAFTGLTLAGIFPISLFGGMYHTLFTLFGAALAAACSGGVVYYKWKRPKADPD